MLRTLVALLLLANLVFWAWNEGALESLGLAPVRERDPSRLSQQVQPDAVRVLSPAAATAALAASSEASGRRSPERSAWVCLEAGPFTAASVEAAERQLAGAELPDGAWVRTRQEIAAQFAVALGPLTSVDAAKKKREELDRLKLPFEAIDLPVEGTAARPQPGLSLGRYDSRSAADAALAAFSQRGVQTARVVVLRPAGSEIHLRVENASPAQAERLRGLSGAAIGAGFAPCAAASAPR